MSAGILGCQSREEGALACSGQRPGLLLCILGHTAQPPQMSVVPRLRNPAPRQQAWAQERTPLTRQLAQDLMLVEAKPKVRDSSQVPPKPPFIQGKAIMFPDISFLFLSLLISSPIEWGHGTSLVVQWLRLCISNAGYGVQPLVRELRSHMPLMVWPKYYK